MKEHVRGEKCYNWSVRAEAHNLVHYSESINLDLHALIGRWDQAESPNPYEVRLIPLRLIRRLLAPYLFYRIIWSASTVSVTKFLPIYWLRGL
jgi:hypothetical protein